MSNHERPAGAPRREFLGRLAASAAALAGVGCAAPAVATVSTAPAPAGGSANRAAGAWDDSWTTRLTSKHRAVFDNPELDSGGGAGTGVVHATRYITGMRDALGANDAQTVMVIRHKGIALAFNDAMWSKYALGDVYKYKLPGENEWATHNPVAGPRGNRAASNTDRPQSNLAWLAAHGHILLGCDAATNGLADELATKTKTDRTVVYNELRQNVVPGLVMQPNGVYAVHRAQEAGCTYIRST